MQFRQEVKFIIKLNITNTSFGGAFIKFFDLITKGIFPAKVNQVHQ